MMPLSKSGEQRGWVTARSSRRALRLLCRSTGACLQAGLLLAAGPALAQTNMTTAAGLAGWARPGRPAPVIITLANTGRAARVWAELGLNNPYAFWERVPRYRLAETTLPPGAAQRFFLYPAAPPGLSPVPEVALWEGGHEVNRLTATLQWLEPGDLLLVAAGRPLSFLSDLPLPLAPGAPSSSRPSMSLAPPTPRLRVAAVAPGDLPDRAAGYAAA